MDMTKSGVYVGMHPSLADKLRGYGKQARLCMKRGAEETVKLGGILKQAQKDIGHGDFGKWVKEETGISDRQARRLIAVHDKFQSKSDIMSDLTPTVLFELSSPSVPEKVIDVIAEKAKAGEKITVADAKKAVAEAKPAKSKTKTETAETNGREPGEDDAPLDRNGHEIPDRLQAAFSAAEQLKQARLYWGGLLDVGHQWKRTLIGKWGFRLDRVEKALDVVAREFERLVPREVCDVCKGSGDKGSCRKCRGRGAIV